VSYDVPQFSVLNDKPLLYVSFGSLGAGDTELMKRLISAISKMPVRALFNVGEYMDAYELTPDNIHISGWYPQPSVIRQVDAVIHHGGNNSLTECLYFGKPAIIMPYVWDGHDNATRVDEAGHGFYLHRLNWTKEELAEKINRMMSDEKMKATLAATSAHMQGQNGPVKAAKLLDELVGDRE
jgi:MGT family glycosyltransferase